jgi:hypothetical protein
MASPATPPPSSKTQIAAELRTIADQIEAIQSSFDLKEGVRAKNSADSALRAYIRARRARDSVMPSDIFSDPGWDILLDLLLSHLEKKRVSVSAACIAAAVPSTTALRWISLLETRGAIRRVADPGDRRRSHLELTPTIRENLLRWVERHLMPSVPKVESAPFRP